MTPITHKDLATLTAAAKPFTRTGWIWELKYDGFRVLLLKDGARVRLLSRNGRDMASSFPELVATAQGLRGDLAIDGELVVLDENGKPQFEAVSRRALTQRPIAVAHAAETTPAAIFAFDVLAIGAKDLRRRPLMERKGRLEALVARAKRILFAQHIGENGERLYAEAVKLELEGIVGKHVDAPYTAGRCRYWVKIKTPAGRAREALRMEHLRG